MTTGAQAFNFNLPLTSSFMVDPMLVDERGQGFAHEMSREGNILGLEILYELGADLELEDHKGYRPLHMAAFFGEHEIVSFLLVQGIDVDPITENGDTPLMRAVRQGHLATAQALLNGGADINFVNSKTGQTALHMAAEYSTPRMIGLLIKAKADLYAIDKCGMNACDTASFTNNDEIAIILQKIMAHKELA